MFKHLLVPLDGSTMAEAALPVAAYLAQTLQARVTLIHVIEKSAPKDVHGEPHLHGAGEASSYLEALRTSFAGSRTEWDYHVHAPGADNVAGTIVAHEAELHPDLIIMCTHGPANLERLLRGSLAQQVVALGRTPLLLVPPSATADETLDLRQILLPLDGTTRHEGGIGVTLDLAALTGSHLQLLAVVPAIADLTGPAATLSRFLPGTSRTMQDLTLTNLREYLEEVRTRAAAQGISVGIELRQGDVAEGISQAAVAVGAEMIVLNTHGKAGTQAFWANSVAARVLSKSDRLLLLVPA